MAILRSAGVYCQSSELLKWAVASVFSAVMSMGQIDVTDVVPAGGAERLFSHWRVEEFHNSERTGKLSAVKNRDGVDRVPCRPSRITYIVLDVFTAFLSPIQFCVLLYPGSVLLSSLWWFMAGCFDTDGLTPLGIASLKVHKDSVSSEELTVGIFNALNCGVYYMRRSL
jgi:hypothetical protein